MNSPFVVVNFTSYSAGAFAVSSAGVSKARSYGAVLAFTLGVAFGAVPGACARPAGLTNNPVITANHIALFISLPSFLGIPCETLALAEDRSSVF